METTRRVAAWKQASAVGGDTAETRAVRKRIEREVVSEIQSEHQYAPKYECGEASEAEFLRENAVDVVSLHARQIEDSGKRAVLDFEGDATTVEEFAARHFRGKGFKVVFVESVPFHVLFGVFTWMLFQDPADSCVRIVGFGSRTAFEEGKKGGEPIWTHLPEDFGTVGYATRRLDAINRHFREMFGEPDAWLFDYWLAPSTSFREYLWAHRNSDVARARDLLQILPNETILAILRYLVGHYWGRYLGWPDLLVFREEEFCFVEVKFSKDKLSDDQRKWIADNRALLGLNFKLVKIHRIP